MKKIVFFGTPDHSAQVLSYFLEHCSHEIEVVGAVTNPDRYVGRKKILTASPVKKVAKEHNIPVFTPEKFDENVNADLQVLCADFFIIVAYGTLIPQSTIDIPLIGTFNLHFSLLPKYRGASPIQSALLNGDKESGISIFSLVKEMDAGDVYIQEKYNLRDETETGKISKYNKNHKRVFDDMIAMGKEKLRALITDFYSFYPVSQNNAQATFCGKFQKSDGEVDLKTISKKELSKKYNGYFVWPGIFYFEDEEKTKRVKLIELVFDLSLETEAGIREYCAGKDLFVGDIFTHRRRQFIVLAGKENHKEFVEIKIFQREGKKPVVVK